MSAKVQALVWEYYNPARAGAPIVLAVALADEADDHGGGIFQSNDALAAKTRQTERAVRLQLRRLEGSKVLICEQRSTGGAGKFSLYRLDIAALIVLKNPERGSGITRNVVPGSDDGNPESGSGFSDPTYKGSKDLNLVGEGTGNRVQADDDKLARWMLGRLRALNPKHREPSWRGWLRDIRLLRERDKRTHREIAELFAWANADPFWQANILSPAKLREKWEQLELKRRANGGGGSHAGQAEDRTCVGDNCGKPGAFKAPDGKWRCHGCRELQGASA
jgi:hypothetical protein